MFLAAALIGLAACGQAKKETTVEDVKQEVQDLVDVSKDFASDSFDRAKEAYEKLSDDVKATYKDQLEDIEKKQKELNSKLEEYNHAAEDKKEALKAEADQLKKALDASIEAFNKEMSKKWKSFQPFYSQSVICFAFVHELNAQILYTESFNVILDTSKTVKGSFMPSFRYRNVKKEFIEISNTADISFRHNNHALTLANKLEYTLYGNENLMSGGYVYVEYLNIQDRLWAIEPYIQIHWQETRGLEQKYAGGTNLRLRVIAQPGTGIFAGLGALYQYERWNYSGVPESIPLPPTTPDTNPSTSRFCVHQHKKASGSVVSFGC